MSEKLEQALKKIHIYLANCKATDYSKEEVIVSKKRIFAMLEELNYAVYELMEEYEGTTSARERGQLMAERMASDIKEDARLRAEDVYAASLIYTQNAMLELKHSMEEAMNKTQAEYKYLMDSYEVKMKQLQSNEDEIIGQLNLMADSKTYLQIIEEKKLSKASQVENLEKEEELHEKTSSKSVGSAVSEDLKIDFGEKEEKEVAPVVVTVHQTPYVPEGFGNRKKKNKKSGEKAKNKYVKTDEEGNLVAPPDGAVYQAEDFNLDMEYFKFQEEQSQKNAETTDGTDNEQKTDREEMADKTDKADKADKAEKGEKPDIMSWLRKR